MIYFNLFSVFCCKPVLQLPLAAEQLYISLTQLLSRSMNSLPLKRSCKPASVPADFFKIALFHGLDVAALKYWTPDMLVANLDYALLSELGVLAMQKVACYARGN